MYNQGIKSSFFKFNQREITLVYLRKTFVLFFLDCVLYSWQIRKFYQFWQVNPNGISLRATLVLLVWWYLVIIRQELPWKAFFQLLAKNLRFCQEDHSSWKSHRFCGIFRSASIFLIIFYFRLILMGSLTDNWYLILITKKVLIVMIPWLYCWWRVYSFWIVNCDQIKNLFGIFMKNYYDCRIEIFWKCY